MSLDGKFRDLDQNRDKVKNKEGTAKEKAVAGSWKQHWEQHSNKKWPQKCRIQRCDELAASGAHVYIRNVNGTFILPMCLDCNCYKQGWLKVKYRSRAVQVDKIKDVKGFNHNFSNHYYNNAQYSNRDHTPQILSTQAPINKDNSTIIEISEIEKSETSSSWWPSCIIL